MLFQSARNAGYRLTGSINGTALIADNACDGALTAKPRLFGVSVYKKQKNQVAIILYFPKIMAALSFLERIKVIMFFSCCHIVYLFHNTKTNHSQE